MPSVPVNVVELFRLTFVRQHERQKIMFCSSDRLKANNLDLVYKNSGSMDVREIDFMC